MYNTTKPYTKKIMEMIRATWETDFCVVKDGPYPVVHSRHNWPLVDHTDGIGTKGHYHWKARTFKWAALDALAMNLNDLFMYGAIPIKIQNHVYLPEDDHGAILEIVECLVDECKNRKIVMTGGETSIHDMGGMEISVTMSGIAIPEHTAAYYPRKGNMYGEGDVLVGIPSNGLHANGTTLVTKVLGGVKDEWLVPTRIYDEVRIVYHTATALNHITGGAYTKLKPFLPADCDANFKFEDTLPIFREVFDTGVDSPTMYKTLNCGYGFVLGVRPSDVEYMLKATGGKVIGSVSKGSGLINITSAFDGETFSY